MTTIHSLSTELHLQILEEVSLSAPSTHDKDRPLFHTNLDLFSCALVCRGWSQFALKLLNAAVYLDNPESLARFLGSRNRKRFKTSELVMRDVSWPMMGDWQELLEDNRKEWKRLELKSLIWPPSVTCLPNLESLTLWEQVDLPWLRPVGRDLLHSPFPNLKHLAIGGQSLAHVSKRGWARGWTINSQIFPAIEHLEVLGLPAWVDSADAVGQELLGAVDPLVRRISRFTIHIWERDEEQSMSVRKAFLEYLEPSTFGKRTRSLTLHFCGIYPPSNHVTILQS